MIYQRPPIVKIPPKKKWESIVKKLTSSLEDSSKEEDQWFYTNRRYAALLDDFLLSNPQTIENPSKIKIFFFCDVSGSCVEYNERFHTASKSLPEKFQVEYFTFDTKAFHEREAHHLGWGTNFHCIERKIQDFIKQQQLSYPDLVFILTDGYGDYVEPAKPKRWHWFLTEHSVTDYIPADSTYYNLGDFE